MTLKRLLACGVALGLVLATGCADSGLYDVTGKVSLDGAPLKEGRILFRQVDGDQRAYSGAITDGAYKLQSGPGKMRVEITASRIVPGKFDTSNGTKEPVGEMYIPEKYNSRSELTAEVSGSSREHSFELTSK